MKQKEFSGEKKIKVILIVLDGVGVGALPDAMKYDGILTCNTLGNTARAVGGLTLPTLQNLGLGNITFIEGVNPTQPTSAAFGKMGPICEANDSVPLHWEMVGIVTEEALPLYPNGLPTEIIEQLEKLTKQKFLGNIMITKSEVLEYLRDKHMKTGNPILYTTNDSVLQIVACPDIIPVEELYKICRKARKILVGKHNVGRVVAKPFIKTSNSYVRLTAKRRDYVLPPPEGAGLLASLKSQGYHVIGIGKICDFFSGRGLTRTIRTKNNIDGINKILNAVQLIDEGLIFVNLIDFDTFGHSNDAKAFARCLREFEGRIPEILDVLQKEDFLIITADHGCDPTISEVKTHTREYVPLLVYNERLKGGVNLGTRKSFADVGATIAEIFKVNELEYGRSFLEEVKIECK